MFSGGDSSDGINNLNQLGGAYGFVNQVAVTNAMAAGQNIDWAQLAQQWIQMRDNSTMETKADTNACANKVADLGSCNSAKFEEKGEADMDMDDEEQTDDKETQQRLNNDFTAQTGVHNNLNQPWFFSEGNPSQLGSRTMDNSGQWNSWPNRPVAPLSLHNQTNNLGNRPVNPTAHIPSLLKMNVPHPNEIRIMPDIPNQAEGNTNVMDAAKRKGLPAWIREGLEKMEREKQKQLEKEQKNKDTHSNSSDDENTSNKNILSKSLNSLNEGTNEILDGESTDNEDIGVTMDANVVGEGKKDENDDDSYISPVGKTYEQKLADLMIVVRRTLTELLLEATNEEISKVAEETVKSFKSKASSAQVIRKSALSTLTGKLGLAAYGDSSSENSSDDDDDHNSSKKATGQSESENDSEEEIRNAIRQKRRTFIKTSEEIEERVASAAAREEEKLKYYLRKEDEEEREHNRKKQERSLLRDQSSSSSGHSGNKGYEKDFGEITETKIQHLNGKRQRDRSSRRERTSRFSDNKDKYVAVPNVATFLTNINAATNSGSGSNVQVLPNNIQRQPVPDINGLLPNYTSAGMTNVLNAADAALDKVLKGKSSKSPEKQSRRHDRDRNYTPTRKRQRRISDSKKSRSRSKSSSSSTSSSSSSSTSSDSNSSSTSRSSHHLKYKQRSATKHKKSSDRHYEKSHKDHRNDRKYSSSSSSYKKRDHESTNSRYHRNASSDSEDEYRRRHKYDSHYSRKSSHSRNYTSSSRRERDREHSRSQSRSSYSSSSNRRQ